MQHAVTIKQHVDSLKACISQCSLHFGAGLQRDVILGAYAAAQDANTFRLRIHALSIPYLASACEMLSQSDALHCWPIVLPSCAAQ